MDFVTKQPRVLNSIRNSSKVMHSFYLLAVIKILVKEIMKIKWHCSPADNYILVILPLVGQPQPHPYTHNTVDNKSAPLRIISENVFITFLTNFTALKQP